MAPNESAKLAPIIETLNSKSAEINEIIAALNAKLAALNIGLEEWISPDEDHIQIGYAEVDGSWQLATRHCEEIRWVPENRSDDDDNGDEDDDDNGDEDDDDNGDEDEDDEGDFEPVPGTSYQVAPLLLASREVRIRAFFYMPTFIALLKIKAEQSLEAIRIAKEMLAEL